MFTKEIRQIIADAMSKKPKILKMVFLLILILKKGIPNSDFLLRPIL